MSKLKVFIFLEIESMEKFLVESGGNYLKETSDFLDFIIDFL